MEKRCNLFGQSSVYVGRKGKSRWAAVFLCLILAFMLTGCLSEEEEIVYSLAAGPVNLDPQLAQGEDADFVIRHLFEGLITVRDGEITPAAAESWEVSADGKTYTFRLRSDAAWSDGEPLTAQDFVFAFARLFDPQTHAPAATDFIAIKGAAERLRGEDVPVGVSADGNTLTFALREPDNRFLYLLTTAPASPCREDFFLDTHGRYGLEKAAILGNGPFYLSTWDKEYLRLRGRKDTPAAETVLRLDIGGSETSAEWVQTDGEGETLVYGLLFHQADALFSEKSVRQALFYDLPDFLDAPQSVLPPSLRQGMAPLELPQQDISTARQLFQDGVSAAGGDAYGRSILISEESGLAEDFASLAQIWQRDLGFFLSVELLPERELRDRVEAGEYDCALTPLYPEYAHPAGVLSGFTSDSRKNPCGYQNAAYDALLLDAVRENDPARAAALYMEAEQLLVDDGVFLPLYTVQIALQADVPVFSSNPCGKELTFS